MCPGMESDRPGVCSKCGMALERNPLLTDDGEDEEIRALTRKFWIAAGVLYPFFGILLSPMIAGAAMSFSSVSVILNALRLRKTRI